MGKTIKGDNLSSFFVPEILTIRIKKIQKSHWFDFYPASVFYGEPDFCDSLEPTAGLELCEPEVALDKYQVFFPDINMSEINGLETAQRIKEKNKSALLIFVTAYIDYAMEGYKVETIRFIIKDMLEEVLSECIDTIIQKLKIKNQKVEYTFREGKKELYIDSIIYVEGNRYKVIFSIKHNANIMISYHLYDQLNHIQKDLEQYGFLRIHKSYLVNRKYINDMIKYKAVLYIN